MNLTKETYSDYKNWREFYEDGKTIKNCPYNSSWNELFKERIYNDERFDKLDNKIKELSTEYEKIYPYPDLLFNAFELVSLDNVKVVIIGQDPYFNCEYTSNKKVVPQAMGLSFSIPKGIKIPSSLQNIFSNLLKNKHIESLPNHGNLSSWASQGCLLLNTALTVLDGQSNCHSGEWKWATERMIKYISDKCDNVVFVLWGAPALDKQKLIDLDKHDILVSSHPSGLSAHKPLRNYPAFNDFDHFGKINSLLKTYGKKEISWQI